MFLNSTVTMYGRSMSNALPGNDRHRSQYSVIRGIGALPGPRMISLGSEVVVQVIIGSMMASMPVFDLTTNRRMGMPTCGAAMAMASGMASNVLVMSTTAWCSALVNFLPIRSVLVRRMGDSGPINFRTGMISPPVYCGLLNPFMSMVEDEQVWIHDLVGNGQLDGVGAAVWYREFRIFFPHDD